MKLPDEISFAEGTVITRHFPMAFNLLASKANLKPGEWVLVMGATGALGSSCVQVAKMLGARVIAGAGADERVALAKRFGADFGINYRKQNLAEEVMKLTDGRGVAVVCENIADPTLWPGAFNSLAMGGRLVTAGAHGGGNVNLDVKRLYMKRLRIIGAAGTHLSDVDKAFKPRVREKFARSSAEPCRCAKRKRPARMSKETRLPAKSFSIRHKTSAGILTDLHLQLQISRVKHEQDETQEVAYG